MHVFGGSGVCRMAVQYAPMASTPLQEITITTDLYIFFLFSLSNLVQTDALPSALKLWVESWVEKAIFGYPQ
jgi:hypothetical protein